MKRLAAIAAIGLLAASCSSGTDWTSVVDERYGDCLERIGATELKEVGNTVTAFAPGMLMVWEVRERGGKQLTSPDADTTALLERTGCYE